MTKDQAFRGLKVRSTVNPDQHYVIVAIYDTYAKVSPFVGRSRDVYNIDYEILTPLEETST